MQLVIVQPAISSHLIDNLNASIHLRALLTDLFLLSEVVKSVNESFSIGTNLPSVVLVSGR